MSLWQGSPTNFITLYAVMSVVIITRDEPVVPRGSSMWIYDIPKIHKWEKKPSRPLLPKGKLLSLYKSSFSHSLSTRYMILNWKYIINSDAKIFVFCDTLNIKPRVEYVLYIMVITVCLWIWRKGFILFLLVVFVGMFSTRVNLFHKSWLTCQKVFCNF